MWTSDLLKPEELLCAKALLDLASEWSFRVMMGNEARSFLAVLDSIPC